jgi:SAM-dependent methyltransferase
MNSVFQVYGKKDFELAKKNLQQFRNSYRQEFDHLFIEGKNIYYSGDLLNIIKDFGIVQNKQHEWSTNFLLTYFRDNFLLTDNFLLPEIDRVFPLSEDESFFLANRINVNINDVVLDIGTGSGIYAILAAEKAKHVVAVDINEKALDYALFNANLNGVLEKITFVKSNMLEDVQNEKFSLIVSNPAVIPTPAKSGFYIHSDGGPLGTNMSLTILKSINTHLRFPGRLQMLCTSFSNNTQGFEIEKFILNNFENEPLKFTITELYNPALEQLSKLTFKYRNTIGYNEFIKSIYERNYTALHYLFIEVECADKFKLENKKILDNFTQTLYNGSWNSRVKRLFLVYDKIESKEIVSLNY